MKGRFYRVDRSAPPKDGKAMLGCLAYAMSTAESFVQFVVDQLDNAGTITTRKMFGEYALYSDGKVVALLCDNRLFVKPTEAGRTFIGKVKEAPAYPGAKLSFLIDERIEDGEWLSQLVRLTAEALPAPVPKKRAPKRTPAATQAKPRRTRT
jgi:TfoX/Sxy family transcriptional regulator of competence genes